MNSFNDLLCSLITAANEVGKMDGRDNIVWSVTGIDKHLDNRWTHKSHDESHDKLTWQVYYLGVVYQIA